MTNVLTSHKGSLRPRDLGETGRGADYDASAALRNSWITLATEYSTIPHEMYPWDPFLVKTIRRFDPDFVPVWVRRVYKTNTGSIKITGYHALGRYIVKPVSDPGEPTPLNAAPTLHQGGMDRPVFLGRVLDGQSFGGDYRVHVPFNGMIVGITEAMWWSVRLSNESLKKRGARWANSILEQRKKAIEGVEAEAAYSLNADRHMIKRAIDEGKIDAPPKEPKPFIYVHADTA